MPEPGVAVFGSGSLARGLCCSLSDLRSGPLRVAIVGRRPEPAAELCYLARTRATVSGGAVTFDSTAVAYDDRDELRRLIEGLMPSLVIVCASRQSPWEGRYRASAWTDLVARGGFGLTLPLQADIAVRVATAVARADVDAAVVNACFPDAANPVLAALGLPVLCGVGNAGLIAASLAQALCADRPDRLKVLAHHANLKQTSDEPLAWLDEKPVDDVTSRLAAQRAADRERLNLVTGHTAARLVAALLHGDDWATSVPGPWGMPGGYPVRIRAGELKLVLPAGWAYEQAVAWNRRVGRRDGVDVIDGWARFAEPARDALSRAGAREIVDGFPVTELDEAREVLEAVRTRLRSARYPP